ncbi:MAG: hypothetical protein AAGF26_15950, partial [Cyanobacteria bacterium P01_G01_bin.49]
DPDLAKAWNKKPQDIWIYEGKTLASLKPEEIPELKTRWQGKVILYRKEDLFLPELYFIELEEGLPGGFLPSLENSDRLYFNNLPVTPLLPLNSLLLDYLSSKDLLNKLQFEALEGKSNQVRLTLDLPLSGVDLGQTSQSYHLYKDYELKAENSLGNQLPILQIWPDFKAEGWKEYYGFYYDAELEDATFQVSFPTPKLTNSFNQGLGKYQIAQLDEFPESINCFTVDHDLIGLILLKTPRTVQLRSKWHVGVDFGTSFTNVYVSSKDRPEPLKLENLQRKITNSDQETRLNVLFENFIPTDFIPQSKPLPLSTVLTTRPYRYNKISFQKKLRPILDGRIYIPDNLRFKPREEWMKTNLNWEPENAPFTELFLRHLALHISALAANAGAKEIEWFISYPITFSQMDRPRYSRLWKEITKELQKTTRVQQYSSEPNSKNFKSETVAFAQYFRDYEDLDLVYTTCIDLEEKKSDIAIWEDNNLLHQCSVQLAGRDIFSQFLEKNSQFIIKRFGVDPSNWKNLVKREFNTKLDVWLRLESDNWLKNHRTLLTEAKDLQELVTLMSMSIAGLYYYVGILLKVLYQEGKYKRGRITPVYLGGSSCGFLNWLDDTGTFTKKSEINQFLSRMLSAGSGFEDTEQLTYLSKNSGDEIACGLVLKNTKLKEMNTQFKDLLIVGETCVVKTLSKDNTKMRCQTLTSYSRLEVKGDVNITEFKISELVEIPSFLYEFHKALKDLGIEAIKPLKGYTCSRDLEKNAKLWEKTRRELDDILGKLQGDSWDVRLEPPFILVLKALLKVLGKESID